MKTTGRNTIIYAENCQDNMPGFNIYLNASGQKRFLTYHRHNAPLYLLLKDGMKVKDLKTWSPSPDNSRRRYRRELENSLKRLADCI